MSPRVEKIGDATLYLGDCREILPTIGKVDAVVTDPPYGVLGEEWDDMTTRELARFTMSWLPLVAEKSDTLLTFFAQEKRQVLDPLLGALFDEVRQLVWNKLGGRVSEDGMFYSYEPIYYCHPTKIWSVCEPKALAFAARLRSLREAAGLSKGAVDIAVRGKKTGLCYRWEEAACLPTPEQMAVLQVVLQPDQEFLASYAAAVKAKDQTVSLAREQASRNAARRLDVFPVAPTAGGPGRHPTEKPVSLMAALLDVVSERGNMILDPFNGSGTTGVACIQSGRRYIGIERNPTYFEMACRWLEEAHRQPRLFEDPPPKPVQASIFDGEAA
ncbi:DNA methyltransferase [Phenylobacterium deserti]|uniref:Methyltransferase n=1 Tax=Phenylobacterium deserti TaxID=1914756 RepID=A0A328ABC0_9CAUL|nr:DNA methyltransferase [Phenylobacterium deserti]RAK52093.1 hypothetical protein DJ018_13135 [Phenylobacterium deserti]